MSKEKSNLVLVGMPGAGKSTVGVILAKQSQRSFVDTDILIQAEQGRSLQAIVDSEGSQRLREIEGDILLGLKVEQHVIATGGSAIYSPAGMQNLAENGTIIFLDVSLKELTNRIRDYETRGIARAPGQSLSDLFEERHRLYQQYADFTIDCNHISPEQVCQEILQQL